MTDNKDKLTRMTIEEALDYTSDGEVLDRFWEITKLRIDEEAKRIDGVHDRASKNITYCFSIVALISAQLILSSKFLNRLIESEEQFSNWLLFSIGIVVLIAIWQIFSSFSLAHEIYAVKEWKTWGKSNVARVSLGKEHHAYWRYLMKTAWDFVDFNSNLTNESLGKLNQSMKKTQKAMGLALILLCLLVAAKGYEKTNYPTRGGFPVTTNENGKDKPATQPGTEKPPPTPKPYANDRLKKSEDPPKKNRG